MTFDPMKFYEDGKRRESRWGAVTPFILVGLLLLVMGVAGYFGYKGARPKHTLGSPAIIPYTKLAGVYCPEGVCPVIDTETDGNDPLVDAKDMLESHAPRKHKRKPAGVDVPVHIAAYQPPLIDLFTFPASSSPANVHEYAMRIIKEFYDYKSKPHKIGEFTSTVPVSEDWMFHVSTFSFAGGSNQSFSIDKDGKVILENMTIEDALLSVVAMQSEDYLNRMKAWDMDERKREEERKTNPPSTLKDGKLMYKITPVDILSDGILETTNCGTHEIKVLMFDGAKRVGVLHEMMHVATKCDPSPGIHKAIYRMQGPLLKLLQDNPKMMDYLLKRKPVSGLDDGDHHVVGTSTPTGCQSGADEGFCDYRTKPSDPTNLTGQIAPTPPQQKDSEFGAGSGKNTFTMCTKANETGCVDVMCEGRNVGEGCPNYVPPSRKQSCVMPADIDVCPVQMLDPKASHD